MNFLLFKSVVMKILQTLVQLQYAIYLSQENFGKLKTNNVM